MRGQRNAFLDAVRTIAILRVIAWHTYGYAWISYFIASMPVMFFVAGSLMAQSLDRTPPREVLYRRFRRLLVPLWLFAWVAATVILVYERYSDSSLADVDELKLLWWFVPLWDPEGSRWGIAWWASLWYLRCLTWLLLASPLLLWAWRRISWTLLLLPLAGIVTGEALRRSGNPIPWQFEDLALLGAFWIMGFAYKEGRFAALDTGQRILLCGMFAVGAAMWSLTQDVPAGVVNASYPLHLLVGLAWLTGALAAEGMLGRFALRPLAANGIYWVNERALTIYLWHAAGLFVMYQVLWARDTSGLEKKLFALPIVVSVTFLAVLLFGWVEDFAGGRAPRLWPWRGQHEGRIGVRPLAAVVAPSAVIGVAAVALIAFAALNIDSEDIQDSDVRLHVVPPSGVGLQLRTARTRIMDEAPANRSTSGKSDAVTPEELRAETVAWLEQWGLSGVALTVLRTNGEGWSAAIGEQADGAPFLSGEAYDAASITKTFTAAMILQLVERGLVSLDDPLSRFVPDFPKAELVTVRQLIQHTSGLIATDGIPPDEALELAASAGLQFEPGSGFTYSSPGYYMLGLIIEQVLGVSYTRAIHQQLLDPLGLRASFIDEELARTEESTHPYSTLGGDYEGVVWSSGGLHYEVVPEFEYHGTLWSSAGLRSTTEDLARWAIYLWQSDRVLSAETRDSMVTFLGPEFQYAGLATYPYCPCWIEEGRIRAERWGHLGLSGALEYDPHDKVSLAFSTSGTVVDENVIIALDDLSARLRRLIRDREMPLLLRQQP